MGSMKSYAGAIAHVELTSGKTECQPLGDELARGFMGGFGLNHKLALDLLEPRLDPLSPDNLVIIGAGALGGTIAPASSKIFATTKFPASRAVASAAGGSFGDALKNAGFDHLVVRGKSAKPAYLLVEDGSVRVVDATDLWGQDIYETTDRLKSRHGAQASVIAIGAAGENLVRYSFALVNKFSTLGRGGLAAVMGSKNLKAIVARGTRPIDVAHRRRFLRTSNAVLDALRSLSYRDDWVRLGSSIAGLRARRNESPDDPYSFARYFENYWKGVLACPSCPVGCKFAVQLKGGRYGGELANMSMPLSGNNNWGQRFNMDSMERAIETQLYCDKQGLDSKTTSNLVDAAVTLFEDGIITEEATQGLPLRRDYETVVALLDQITKRRGIGDLLAEGHEGMLGRYGRDFAERVPMIKGMEAFQDPRTLFNGMAFCQITNPRGSYAVPGNNPTFLPGRTPDELQRYLGRLHVPEDTINRIIESSTSFNVARLTKYTEDWYSVQSSLGVCVRQPVMQCYNVEVSAELYSAASGFETSPEELLKLGEKAWNTLKLVDIREGFTRKDDKLPEHYFEPVERGGQKIPLGDYYGNPLSDEDVEKLIDDYYEERGWDKETSFPTAAKRAELAL